MKPTWLWVLLAGWAVAAQGATSPEEANDLLLRKARLEVQKLELEVAELQKDRSESHVWIERGVTIVLTIGGTLVSVWLARRTQHGELDLSVHDKRLESYPALVEAGGPLAVYFPNGDPPAYSIAPIDCREMGQAMSKWYFGGGGLLMSVQARDAYFRLARALTRASLAAGLKVPSFPGDAGSISVEKLKDYRTELNLEDELDGDDIENWRFGCPKQENETLAQRFRDYVFLQHLGSTLRTRLSEDLRCRRRPS
jgi:hypothetical protein